MIEIGRAVVSLDILEKRFCCDITKCGGACCVEGDSGAPLTEEEAAIIEEIYPEFKEYLSEENQQEISKQGFSVIDQDGDLVTPMRGNNECVFTFTDEQGITLCAIEKAFFEKNTKFRKPVSCHLFPIRISEYKRFDAVNYQKLDICKPGRKCGKTKNLPLWKFLKDPLIRKYGEEWFKELEFAANNLPTEKK
jgi:hypothetical protein